MSRGSRPRPPGIPGTVRWPLPPPGRPRWSWLLGSGLRRWQLRRILAIGRPYFGPAPLVVDLGAGTGADAEEFDRIVPRSGERRFLLVDAQAEMLRRGEDHRRSAAAGPARAYASARGDVTRLPFRDGSVDLVLSLGLLCCVDEGAVPAAIAETTRILAPGGILFLAVPRWRGRADEGATAATGLVRRAGGRPGRAVFQKPL